MAHAIPAALPSPTPRWITYGWRIAVVGLVLALAAVWHISILWLYRDALWVLGAWLGGVFALVATGRALARRIPPEARGRLARSFARLNGVGFIFVAFLLLLLLLFHVGFQRATSDGRSYFVQVRSLVMDHDLNLVNDEADFGGPGADKYAFGAPVLWSPFFVLGHAWLRGLNAFGGHFRADGYYYPYQRAVGLGTVAYGFLALILAYRVLRVYFSRPISALATIGLCSTSFLIWYLTADNSMVHGVSMFATTLFLFLWHRFRTNLTTRRWIGLGAAAGLMATIRWQDGVFALLPVADLLWISWRARAQDALPVRIRATGRDLALFGAAGFVTFSPQLMFWKSVYGTWVYLPSREHGFHPGWIPPFLTEVLFSPNRGLLTWSPVISAALIGLLVFARRHWRVALVLAGGFIGQLWVNGAVEIWWGGVGYGARRFSNSALVFAVGLGALIAFFQRRPLVAPALGLGAFLVYNTAFMLGYRDGALSTVEGVTFDEVAATLHDRIGNPFSLPLGAWVAWRYDVDLAVYERQRGRTYNNLSIDVGGPDDDRFLGHGWAGRESRDAFSFRWTDGDRSTVLVPLKADTDDYLLEIEWAPFLDPALRPQVVDVVVNGTKVASVTVGADMHVDRVEIPSRVLRSNLNQLQFRYRYAISPKEMRASEDVRRLAVQVSTITLTRQMKE